VCTSQSGEINNINENYYGGDGDGDDDDDDDDDDDNNINVHPWRPRRTSDD
jgi:hypothetical protein